MLFRKSTEYAISIVLFLAEDGGDRYIRIKEISERYNISVFKLQKAAQKLIKSEILDSYTGPNGGIKLAKRPSGIRLIDIVRAMGEKDISDTCVLGIGSCGEENPCTLHNQMKQIKEDIIIMYKKKTIDELL